MKPSWSLCNWSSSSSSSLLSFSFSSWSPSKVTIVELALDVVCKTEAGDLPTNVALVATAEPVAMLATSASSASFVLMNKYLFFVLFVRLSFARKDAVVDDADDEVDVFSIVRCFLLQFVLFLFFNYYLFVFLFL